MFNPASLPSPLSVAFLPFGESPAPVPRFCAANNCHRVILPGSFQHESGLCDVCIARIRPCQSFANNSIHGDPSQILFFTPSGEFPHELHANRFVEVGGSEHVPLAPPIMRSRYPQLHHIPPSVYFQYPQPNSHVQTSDSDWMRTCVPYHPDIYVGTNQHVSDQHALSNTGYPNTSFAHEIASRDRQTIEHHSLHCGKCLVFMSSHLVGDGRICSSCLNTSRAKRFPEPSSHFWNPDSIKNEDLTSTDGDKPALMADTTSTSTVKTISAPPIRIKIRPPPPQLASLEQSRPSKRPRIDEGGRNASTESVKKVDQPSVVAAEGNVSKICSTPSCDQTLSIESSSGRCISCVKLDWKSIKDRFKTSKPRRTENTLPSAFARSTKAKPRKSVTWSDTVTVASGDGTIIQCLAPNIEEDCLSVSDDIKQDGEGVDTTGDEVYTPSSTDVVSSTDSRLNLQSKTMESEVRLAPLRKPITDIMGWDSDLSELTELDESDSSDVRISSRGSVHSLAICQPPQVSAPTGLTIKIPARSSIVRKCRNVLCNQVLATSYPRKTCMMCRVHHRQTQQRRKGRNDEISSKINVTMPDETPPKLVPNARLCSGSECAHFIPPHDEYKFKRCSLCRLYQEERRSLRPRGQSDSTKPLVNVKGIYNSFRFLPVRPPIPGRCRSLDCGVLHENSSASCRQCVSRRTKLMKKAELQDEHQEVTTEQNKTLPDLNIYPQYRCYTFLLSDFEDRLKAFLKSQTIFFLFRVHHPSPSGTKALFSFDGEYSVVALDFDVIGRKAIIDARAVKTKKDFEGIDIEGLKFAPKRLISALEGGGVATRFLCTYQASILQPVMDENVMTVSGTMKPMKGELEIAVFPDHSHRCLPGEKTIIRFRLLG